VFGIRVFGIWVFGGGGLWERLPGCLREPQLDGFRTYQPVHNCLDVVIPAEAGIQRLSGFRITSGMTALVGDDQQTQGENGTETL
jgi:hypothetical protein